MRLCLRFNGFKVSVFSNHLVPLVQDNPAHSRSSEEDLFRNVCDVDPDAGLEHPHTQTAVIFAHINKPLKGKTANKNISLVHNVYIPLLIFQGPMRLLLFSYAIYLFRMKPDIFRWNVKVNTAVEVPPFPADFLSWGFMHIQTHTYTYTHTRRTRRGVLFHHFPAKPSLSALVFLHWPVITATQTGGSGVKLKSKEKCRNI